MAQSGVSSADLPPEEKAKRSGSFGAVASLYERYRPGPPIVAVEWILPARCDRAVDLGAGTGALTRLLVDRIDDVVAVEPDDRMREVLTERVPAARAVKGRGDSMPIPGRFGRRGPRLGVVALDGRRADAARGRTRAHARRHARCGVGGP